MLNDVLALCFAAAAVAALSTILGAVELVSGALRTMGRGSRR